MYQFGSINELKVDMHRNPCNHFPAFQLEDKVKHLGESTDKPPIVKTYQRKGKIGIASPIAQIQMATIEEKQYMDNNHTNLEGHQDNHTNKEAYQISMETHLDNHTSMTETDPGGQDLKEMNAWVEDIQKRHKSLGWVWGLRPRDTGSLLQQYQVYWLSLFSGFIQ